MKLTALTSISHNGGDSMGTETKFRRVKIVDANGETSEVPEISGNAMRGLLRDLAHSHLCSALGYGENGERLSLPAFHFLFSGGGLHAASNGLDIAHYERLRKAIPTVSLFGGGVGSALLPGRLKCGAPILICAENAKRIPRVFANDPLVNNTCWNYLDTEMNTRKDDSKNPNRQSLLEPSVTLLLKAKDSAKRKSKEEGTDKAEERGAATQMMYHTEVVIAGAAFAWSITLEDVSDVEWEAFLVALAELARKPWIGGKSGTGHGEIAIHCEGWAEVNSSIAPDSAAVNAPAGMAYARHLQQHAAGIRELLTEMK